MTLSEDQLRQRLEQLADHARTAPTNRLSKVDPDRPGALRPRWALGGAIVVAAAAVLVLVAVLPRWRNTPGRVVHSGPLATQIHPGSSSVVPSTNVTPPSAVASSPTTIHPALDPPDATGPAAGACSQAQTPTGQVVIGPDLVPQPRCLVIRHDQHLSITNHTNHTITPSLGKHFKMTLAAGQSGTFPYPLGTYLAPGVHYLVFTSASAADIWLDAVCRGPGPVDCATP